MSRFARSWSAVALAVLLTTISGFACSGTTPIESGDTTYEGPLIHIRGTIHAADDGPLPAVGVTILAPGYLVTGGVASGGGFDILAPAAGEPFDILVEAERYHPSLRRIPPAPDDWNEVRVLLIPSRWTIDGGIFAGQEIPLSLQDAYAPENGRTGALYLVENPFPPPARGAWRFTADYPAEAFPLPLYFLHDGTGIDGHSREPVTAQDSIAFWEVIADLEARLGRDLFRPVQFEELTADTLTGSNGQTIVLRPFSVSVEQLPSAGLNTGGSRILCHDERPDPADPLCSRFDPYTWVDGTVKLASIGPTPLERFVAQHELIHLLGFGHACHVPTIMTPCAGPWQGTRYPLTANSSATVYDVAFIQLHWLIQAKTRELRPQFGVRDALEGERVRRLGFPGLPAGWPGPAGPLPGGSAGR